MAKIRYSKPGTKEIKEIRRKKYIYVPKVAWYGLIGLECITVGLLIWSILHG